MEFKWQISWPSSCLAFEEWELTNWLQHYMSFLFRMPLGSMPDSIETTSNPALVPHQPHLQDLEVEAFPVGKSLVARAWPRPTISRDVDPMTHDWEVIPTDCRVLTFFGISHNRVQTFPWWSLKVAAAFLFPRFPMKAQNVNRATNIPMRPWFVDQCCASPLLRVPTLSSSNSLWRKWQFIPASSPHPWIFPRCQT